MTKTINKDFVTKVLTSHKTFLEHDGKLFAIASNIRISNGVNGVVVEYQDDENEPILSRLIGSRAMVTDDNLYISGITVAVPLELSFL